MILGKANLSQFANSGSMSDSSYGQVWNAFKPSKSSLGSSGGSAVSVATSMAAFAMGTQTGVSLYAPSTGAGLATFRGTDGMQSAAGVMPLTWATDYAGAIARTVTDLAGILNVVAGTDPDDELTGDADAHKPADWTAYLDRDALRGKTIGYLPSAFTGYAADDGTADAARAKLGAVRDGRRQSGRDAGCAERADQHRHRRQRQRRGLGALHRRQPGVPVRERRGDPAVAEKPAVQPLRRHGERLRRREHARDCSPYRAEYRQVVGSWMDDNGVDAVVYPGFLSDVWDNDGAGSHNGSDRATGVHHAGAWPADRRSCRSASTRTATR